MRILKNQWWWVILTMFILSVVWWFLNHQNGPSLITTVAEIGTVQSAISVTGTATVDDIIPLSFPKGGTVTGVFVARGDTVATGTVLATVGDDTLQSDYASTLAEVTRLRAVRDELLAGQTTEEAAVTTATVENAELALTNTIRTEAARVEAARTTLYSTGLTAIATDPDNDAPLPTISGSYTCTAEGTYTIELYRSGTFSGYSYRYSGIETGVGNASANQSSPLGDCGLRLQFTADTSYTNAVFTITIPNTASPTYATNLALYNQALAQEEANIKAARQALDLALDQSTVAMAGARVEKLIAATANVVAAEARLTKASYLLSESALRSPSSGVITDIRAVVGQTVTASPVITLFTPRRTFVTASIPEKDIANLTNGQTTQLFFDANPTQELSGTITFLSPVESIIGGIPYYDALIEITDTPPWLRSGMQADIQIVVSQLTDVVRIPRLYLIDNQVQIKDGDQVRPITPNVLLFGSDGYVAVEGISAGSQLVLPTN